MEALNLNGSLINAAFVKYIWCDNDKCEMLIDSPIISHCAHEGICGELVMYKKGTPQYNAMRNIYAYMEKRVNHKTN